MTYFITFACYGAHLHGEPGSVDRHHNLVGTPALDPDSTRASRARALMTEAQYSLDENSRLAVLSAIQEVCSNRDWNLRAAHVRTNHVHVVVDADVMPEKAMSDFKSYASRLLNQLHPDASDRKRWAHHGSTRWLRKPEDVCAAVRYVAEEQGQPMALFVA